MKAPKTDNFLKFAFQNVFVAQQIMDWMHFICSRKEGIFALLSNNIPLVGRSAFHWTGVAEIHQCDQFIQSVMIKWALKRGNERILLSHFEWMDGVTVFFLPLDRSYVNDHIFDEHFFFTSLLTFCSCKCESLIFQQ